MHPELKRVLPAIALLLAILVPCFVFMSDSRKLVRLEVSNAAQEAVLQEYWYGKPQFLQQGCSLGWNYPHLGEGRILHAHSHVTCDQETTNRYHTSNLDIEGPDIPFPDIEIRFAKEGDRIVLHNYESYLHLGVYLAYIDENQGDVTAVIDPGPDYSELSELEQQEFFAATMRTVAMILYLREDQLSWEHAPQQQDEPTIRFRHDP